MLVAVLTSLIIAKNGSAFSESVAKHWTEWVVRGLVLLGICSQTALVVLGSRRKYKAEIWLKVIVWLAYQSSDWVTSYSLGVLSRDPRDHTNNSLNPDNVLRPFWAPIFLMQLCNQDTVTSYALEDNELWLRQLFSIGGQFGVAIYILLKSWSKNPINYLSIPLLVFGLIKYVERICVQRKASRDQFRESLLPRPDPGPSYAKFMNDYCSKEAEGYKIELAPLVDKENLVEIDDSNEKVVNIIRTAYYFFGTFKRLFADLILSFQDLGNSQAFFLARSAEEAFMVVEIELGFIYDVLYTKATLIYSWWGFLRSFTLSLAIFVFITFLVKYVHEFSNVDVIITFNLLLGAILQELYALILLLSSDWIRLKTDKKVLVNLISVLRYFHLIPAEKRWSRSIAQHNLLSFSLRDKTLCSKIQKLLRIDDKLEKRQYTKPVSVELKKLLFEQIVDKSKIASDIKICKQLCAYRGNHVIEDRKCIDQLGWSFEVDFDQSILLWHVATDLCYFEDQNSNSTSTECSKSISDYMLYLLVFCPFMLPNGIGEIRFQDTCEEAKQFFKERKSIMNTNEASTELLQVNTQVLPSQVKGDRSKSVLFDACRLAKDLKVLERERNWGREEKWKMISHVWVEMLLYAASHCGWQSHAKQLTEGGELLSHVWLLMTHMGISEQFQISEGHGRVRMVVR